MNQAGRYYDCILVGGGLQAGLIFQALQHYQPDVSILLLERSDELFGNHTWSFHATDVPHASWRWLSRIPMSVWEGYNVHFPGQERHVATRYCSIASSAMREGFFQPGNLDDSLPVAWGSHEIRTGTTVSRVERDAVTMEDGSRYRTKLVIDCRGRYAGGRNQTSQCGFQKFHGFEFSIAEGQRSLEPVLMDSRVDQRDGFRFLYVLPFGAGRVLVEDTRFSDHRDLSRAECFETAREYLNSQGISQFELVREESGCLPMPFGQSLDIQHRQPLQGGYAGGWFHAATGYSFPLAIRFAEVVASGPLATASDRVAALAEANRFQASFARFLNRMLFRLVEPQQRWRIFSRFYRNLPVNVIERFYSHEFSPIDAARLLIGAPPRGLTPFRFVQSFKAMPCPVPQ